MCEKTNVILDLHDINTDNIHVLEPIRNTIIQNGYFRRIIYSNEFMTLNNLIVHLNVSNAKIQKYYQKYKCYINESIYESMQMLVDLEHFILNNTGKNDKIQKANLLEQVRNGFVKFFNHQSSEQNVEYHTNFTLQIKISGIWETDTEYGITYKIVSF